MSEHRWSKFWWQDYEGDDALRLVSLAAQGLWMRMLCAMHRGEPHGHLAVNGNAPTARQLSIMLCATEREITKLVPELEAAGVLSRTDAGIIYSRRLVRDKAIRDQAIVDGRRGGNPALKGKGKPGGLTPPSSGDDAVDEQTDAQHVCKNRDSHSADTANGHPRPVGKNAEVIEIPGNDKRKPLTPPDKATLGETLKQEAEAEAEAEKEIENSVRFPRVADAERAAPEAGAEPSWPPKPHPSAVTARVDQVVARLEGRARGQPFLTARGPVRSVDEQIAVVKPKGVRAHALPAEVLQAARAAVAQGRR
jgi:hypothetical protein